MKQCCKCGEVLEPSEFYIDSDHSDGLSSRCKECCLQYSRERNLLSPPHYLRVESGMKDCSKCAIEKPVSDFHSDRANTDGLKAHCRECVRLHQMSETSQAARKARRRDPVKRAMRNASIKARRARIFGQYKRGRRKLERGSRHRMIRLEEHCRIYERRLRYNYGDLLADLYAKNPFRPHSKLENSDAKLLALKIEAIRIQTGLLMTRDQLRRVELLNLVSDLPKLNIGWHCMACGLVESDPMFFDVDHIVPRAAGGGNAHENLQPLCPNCHRKKTLGINGVSSSQSFRRTSEPLQLQAL